MPVDYLYWLDQIQPPHRSLVGDKAFYLALLLQRGYDVIPGFAISADAFQEFLEQINWLEPMFADLPNSSLHVDVDNSRQLQAVAYQIRQAIQAAPVPDSWLAQLEAAVQSWQTQAVILRPSFSLPSGSDPTVSLRTTGLLESHLCQTDQQAIGQSLKRVWAELFRARSLLYWQRLDIQPQHIRLAVLVQPIRSAIAAGDVQMHDTYLEIRAIWGLGKALVLGEAIPDCYQIFSDSDQWTRRLGKQIRSYRIAEEGAASGSALALPFQTDGYITTPLEPLRDYQPILTDSQIQTLVQLTQQVAADLGTALNLEWTLNSSPAAEPSLSLTQAVPQLALGFGNSQRHDADRSRPASSLPPMPAASPLTGLAAAPGKVRAIAYVLSDRALPPVPPGAILVVPLITPDWLLRLEQLAGIITEQGGMTSHGAILAREQGIPAVVGVEQATRLIQTGDWLLLDGDRGEVYRQGELSRSTDPAAALVELPIAPALLSPFPAASAPAVPAALPRVESVNATQLFVTLSQPNTIAQVAHLPIDGVGLLRAELLLAAERQPPQDWLPPGQQTAFIQRLARQVERFVQAFAPRPVFYRSLDWRSHEFPSLKSPGLELEANPALGLRGSLSYQVNPTLFEAELAALRQVQHWGYSNLRLILPFVRTVEEFVFCRQRVEQAGLTQHPQFQLWIMAEVPSVLLLLPDYIAAGVQGVAIGTNDLTQLLLGVDRDQRQLATAFNPSHPAVMRAIRQIIATTRQANIPCSICGQGPGQSADMVEALVRWGITAISVEPIDVAGAYRAIARAEKRLLLEAARAPLPEEPIA